MTTSNADRPESDHHQVPGADSEFRLADSELLRMITDTDAQLDRLREELKRRMQERAQEDLKAEQHAEIAKLVEHLEQAKIDWLKVRAFFHDAFIEQRTGAPWGAEGEHSS